MLGTVHVTLMEMDFKFFISCYSYVYSSCFSNFVIFMAVNINNTFVNLKIGSLNCRGLNDHNKRQLLFSKFKQSDCTIICLQETKLHPEDESTYVN